MTALRILAQAEARLDLKQRFRVARARAKRLLAKADAHTDWMNECVPQLMDYGKDQDVAIAACLNMWRDTWEDEHPDGAVDPGPPPPGSDSSEGKQLRIARQRLREFDPNEPRDDDGKWTSGGGSSSDAAAPADKPDADAHLDPKVIEVGGDAWNKATARRLEREYQSAKPALDALTAKYAGLDSVPDTAVVEPDEDTEPPYNPESWDEVSNEHQEQAFEKYKESQLPSYIENEQQNWHDNGQALDEAKVVTADEEFWLASAIKEHLDESETRFPLTAEQLADAIVLEYDSNDEGTGDLTINYLDKDIAGVIAENTGNTGQQTLPGIEPEDLSAKLTDKMRDELNAVIEKAFDKTAEEKSSDMTPPAYLSESAAEFIDEDWNHNMEDKSKFEWTKNNTDLLDDPEAAAPIEEVTGLPNKYDPLNETTGGDYKRTQQLARALSIQRAKEVLQARKLPDPGTATLKLIDTKLWSAWKSSSTSPNGQLLQVASADELGGRLNPKTGQGGAIEINRNNMIEYADSEFKDIGGYKGVLAYVRAKWETTQYLLDKAGIPELKLYRGISLDKDKLDQALKEKLLALKQMVGDHAKVPNLTVVRNGAASTTTDPDIANGWGNGNRLVLRAQIPRTAALSIPAYGINVQSEHEVVVTGTAWKGWDAWLNKAPHFEHVAMAA